MNMKLILEDGKLDVINSKVCGIYGFLFPDGKWLVGYSSNIVGRFGFYYRDGFFNQKCKSAISSHGLFPIKAYVLEECDNKKDTLLRREEYWSTKLDSVNNGYNVAFCGYGSVGGGKFGHLQTTKYDSVFKSKVSEAMKKFHAKRKKEKFSSTSGYIRWNFMWKKAKNISPGMSIPENLAACLPFDNDFAHHWNAADRKTRIRLRKKFSSPSPTPSLKAIRNY